MSKRCEYCGRKTPCAPCDDREVELRARAVEDAWAERAQGERTAIMVAFEGPDEEQLQNLTRLCAEWPYAIEIQEPCEDGSADWQCRLAFDPESLGGTLVGSWVVGRSSVRRCEFDEALRAFFERCPAS